MGRSSDAAKMPMRTNTIPMIINNIVKQFPIHDINIGNPRIETIIKRIYNE